MSTENNYFSTWFGRLKAYFGHLKACLKAFFKAHLQHILMTALWIGVLLLGALTAITIITSLAPSNCKSLLLPGSPSGQCNRAATLSEYVRDRVNIFQSMHTFLLQSVGTLGLLVFIPKLRAEAWESLDDTERGTSVQQLNSAVALSTSPSLLGALQYALSSKRYWALTTLFVVAMGFLGLVSSFVVAPIYRVHYGPYTLRTPFVIGGGMSEYPRPAGFDPLHATAASAVGIGRSLLSAETTSNQTWNTTTMSRNVIPFIVDADVFRVWRYKQIGVVAYTSINCDQNSGQFFPPPYGIDPQSLYWSNETFQEGNLTLNGLPFPGQIYNDPNLSTTYQNITFTKGPGWIQAYSLVTFIVGNNTIEGAQVNLESPNTNSRISALNILTCNSTVRLAMSTCTVQSRKGYWDPSTRVDTTCTQLSPTDVPKPAYPTPFQGGFPTGILDDYLTAPFAVAAMLSTAPVWSIAAASDRLPTYWRLIDYIKADTVPLAATSGGAGDTVPMISQAYIKDILFASAQHSLIQGVMRTFGTINNRTTLRSESLRATFGTSWLGIQIAILAVAFISAFLATFFALLPTSREAQEFDVPRLIAVAQSPHFEKVFGEYSDPKKPIPEDVRERRVRYDRSGSSRLIVVGHIN